MMTRFVLTLLVGLVVSLGALVSGGSGVALAGNWNNTAKNELHGLPEVNVYHAISSADHYNHNTSDFDTLGEQLGHLVRWADICNRIIKPYDNTSEKLRTEFYKHLSQRDKAFFRKTRDHGSMAQSGGGQSLTTCEKSLVFEIYHASEGIISWLKENPGSNLPELSEWQSKILKQADVGVTQVASARTTSSNKPPGELVKCELYECYLSGSSRAACQPHLKPKNKVQLYFGDFKLKPGFKSLIFQEPDASGHSQKLTLTPGGNLIGIWMQTPHIPVNNGAQNGNTPYEVRYQCDKTSIEVAALLDKLEKQPVTEVVEQQTPTQENDPLAKAKATCSDLGFASGTEKHGNCVLKIAGNSGSEVASASIKAETVSSNDTKAPAINIASAFSVGPEGTIKGYVRDNASIAEVRVDGQLVKVDSFGNFLANTYVPEGGISVSIEAVDLAGLSSSMSVRLDRSASTTTASISFERLNPLGRKVAKNKDALALIIGVDGYKSTPARAIYADSDAKVFTDYASQKLGIPTNRIKTLVNDGAGEREMLLSVKSWLARASKQGKSDVYVFFAGHGLASDDGQKMYLLPYDGAPELLEKTAILRQELFDDIASANPRSVTVFLDTCYSGTTRGTDMLIASRPIAIKALKQSIPDNFTVMTAARGDQTAKPLEEAKHGMFSYFLMKGMEGEADANNDNKITAGELHQYVQSNVIQQSSGSQTPELQGDAERVLVRFQ